MSEPVEESTESGTHLRILQAAAHLFRFKGYEATTLRGIAAECGLKAGSIYYHFSSKDEILAEVLDFGIRQLLVHVTRAVEEAEDQSPVGRIRAALCSHLRRSLEFDDFTATNIRVFSQAPAEIQEQAKVERRRYEELWKSLFQAAQKSGDIRKDVDLSIARLFLIGGMSWTLEWYRPGGASATEIADKFADLLCHGMLDSTRG